MIFYNNDLLIVYNILKMIRKDPSSSLRHHRQTILFTFKFTNSVVAIDALRQSDPTALLLLRFIIKPKKYSLMDLSMMASIPILCLSILVINSALKDDYLTTNLTIRDVFVITFQLSPKIHIGRLPTLSQLILLHHYHLILIILLWFFDYY